jgi:hypothetical protein
VDDDYDGVLIPGSHYSAYDDLPWVRDARGRGGRGGGRMVCASVAVGSVAQIHRLKDYLRACYIPLAANHNAPEHRLKPQIVGSCFGCQVSAVPPRQALSSTTPWRVRPAQLIALAMGGMVTKNPSGKYVVKAEEIFIQVRRGRPTDTRPQRAGRRAMGMGHCCGA